MPDEVIFEKEILARKIRLLYANLLGGLIVNAFVSVLLFYLFLPSSVGPNLYVWFSGAIVVTVCRFVDYLLYRRRKINNVAGTTYCHLLFVVGSTAQGVLWGLAGVLFFATPILSNQGFLIAILSGMAGGSVIFLSPIIHVYILYLIPTLLPLSIYLMFSREPGYFFIGIIGIGYGLTMIYASLRTNKWIDSTLRTTFEKETLADHLKIAHDQQETLVTERTAELAFSNEILKKEIEERKKTENALHESELFLFSVFENIPDMIFVKDAIDLRFVRLNRAGEKLLGCSRDSFIGKNDYDFFPKEEADFFIAKDREVLKKKQLLEIQEESIQIKNKGQRFLHTKKIPVYDQNGTTKYLLGISEDITDKKRAEEDKKKLETQLFQTKKIEAIGTLAGGIAHDFNNLLTAILGNINLALMYTEQNNKSYTLLENAEKASLRAKDLTQQLLTFAKGGDPVKSIASIEEVIKDSADFILRGSNTTCVYQFDQDLWSVEIDKGQISQVIQNFILNASHAMPDGGVIDVESSNFNSDNDHNIPLLVGNYIKIIIRDRGIGISSNLFEKIFDPYLIRS